VPLGPEQEAEHCRSRHVDGVCPPWQYGVVPCLDEAVSHVSGGGADHAASQHCQDDHDEVPPAEALAPADGPPV
jgi:hypothetical protein